MGEGDEGEEGEEAPEEPKEAPEEPKEAPEEPKDGGKKKEPCEEDDDAEDNDVAMPVPTAQISLISEQNDFHHMIWHSMKEYFHNAHGFVVSLPMGNAERCILICD